MKLWKYQKLMGTLRFAHPTGLLPGEMGGGWAADRAVIVMCTGVIVKHSPAVEA
jgi:hypothetical protein